MQTCAVTTAVDGAILALVGTLADRLEELAALSGGHSALSRAADLKRQHINNAIARLRVAERNPEKRAEIELSTAVAIADAAKVSLRWLATGEGPRQEGALPPAPAERAALAAELLGYPSDAIKRGVASAQNAPVQAVFAGIVQAATAAMLAPVDAPILSLAKEERAPPPAPTPEDIARNQKASAAIPAIRTRQPMPKKKPKSEGEPLGAHQQRSSGSTERAHPEEMADRMSDVSRELVGCGWILTSWFSG